MARLNKDAIVAELELQDIFANATKTQIKEFVEDFFDSIATKVANGDEVAIAGFGKFENYTRQNGAHKPKFTPFKEFKEAVEG